MKQTKGIKTTTDCLTEISVKQQTKFTDFQRGLFVMSTRAKILFFLDLQSSRLACFCCTEVVLSSPELLSTKQLIREVREGFYNILNDYRERGERERCLNHKTMSMVIKKYKLIRIDFISIYF